MATVKHDLIAGAAWTEVATASQDFLVSNRSSSLVYYTLQDSAPDLSEEAYDILDATEGLIRMKLTGALYIRVPPEESNASVIVTT